MRKSQFYRDIVSTSTISHITKKKHLSQTISFEASVLMYLFKVYSAKSMILDDRLTALSFGKYRDGLEVVTLTAWQNGSCCCYDVTMWT